MIDVDGDGVIAMHELHAAHPQPDDHLFKYIDTNNDDEISLDEFKLFFSKLMRSKGSRSVELLIEYFRMNATRAANGDSISALPVSALLLDSHSYLKPDAVSSPAEVQRSLRGVVHRICDHYSLLFVHDS